MSEPVSANSAAAAAAGLVAAAACSMGVCPTDPAGAATWERAVAGRAHSLARMVGPLTERLAILAEVKPVTGVIVSVRSASGRAVITTRPTMGNRQTEDFRTQWLNEPAGAALAALAQSLVGRHVRLGKRLESTADGQKKVGMVEWITDLGPDPDAPGRTPRTRTETPLTRTEPAPSRLAVAYPGMVSDNDRNNVLRMARQVTGDRRRQLEDWMRANDVPPLASRSLTAEQAMRVRAFLAVAPVSGAA